ncbi:glycosyltransferase family 4 protein [Halobellus rufus]|uniref:glycosyltransferase family 4 protein n=1 Tax=Halobellus rufus TaxID=1448860 RepID=UPI000678DAD1|nr:glycosyltransferase family 4 protein [Halobellus rufus]
MRVLSLVTNGHSRFYRQQCDGLRERGHEVDTLAVPGRSKESGRSMWTYAKYYPRVLAASAGDYDLVHANYGLSAPPAVVQPSLPTVLSLWGSDLMGTYGWLSRYCARFAEEVIVMSPEMAALLDRPTHVIPHGIDLDLFRPLPQSFARREVGWREDRYQVLFPYRPFRPVKNFDRAERVVESARERVDRPIELQVADGVEHSRMPVLMNAADAILLTSNREGSPNTVKEAMACNVPVIATDVGDLSERLEPIAHSTVSDDDDALAAALAATLRTGERSDGREAIAEIGLSRQLDRLEAVFERAVGSS